MKLAITAGGIINYWHITRSRTDLASKVSNTATLPITEASVNTNWSVKNSGKHYIMCLIFSRKPCNKYLTSSGVFKFNYL